MSRAVGTVGDPEAWPRRVGLNIMCAQLCVSVLMVWLACSVVDLTRGKRGCVCCWDSQAT